MNRQLITYMVALRKVIEELLIVTLTVTSSLISKPPPKFLLSKETPLNIPRVSLYMRLQACTSRKVSSNFVYLGVWLAFYHFCRHSVLHAYTACVRAFMHWSARVYLPGTHLINCSNIAIHKNVIFYTIIYNSAKMGILHIRLFVAFQLLVYFQEFAAYTEWLPKLSQNWRK